nr:hypothetical protein [Tanacetum cinerariifolium]
FQKGDDPINAINHMMSFLTAIVTSRYPSTNNQLRSSSNPRQQATINNGRVTTQPIQGRQNSLTAVPVANAPRAVDLADSPVSTSIEKDAPSISALFQSQGGRDISSSFSIRHLSFQGEMLGE